MKCLQVRASDALTSLAAHVGLPLAYLAELAETRSLGTLFDERGKLLPVDPATAQRIAASYTPRTQERSKPVERRGISGREADREVEWYRYGTPRMSRVERDKLGCWITSIRAAWTRNFRTPTQPSIDGAADGPRS